MIYQLHNYWTEQHQRKNRIGTVDTIEQIVVEKELETLRLLFRKTSSNILEIQRGVFNELIG
jgi:hypothetical protein